MSLALLLFSCADAPPSITSVSPDTARLGETLTILGTDFQEGATGTLGGQPMAVSFKGLIKLEGTVPELQPGAHELVVSNPDGQSTSLSNALTVPEPPEEIRICSAEYTAYSQFAGGRKLIKIDRHHPDGGEPERLEIHFDEVEAVEYEGRVQEEDYCSAILLRLTDGRRIVYEDSKDLNFRSKAQEIAQAMAKPVDVIHEDEVPR